MPKIQDIVVANTDGDFDTLLRGSALLANFVTGADRDRFSAKSRRLRQNIEGVCQSILKPTGMIHHFHINYDWWPDHTRYVDLEAVAFDENLYDALHALLMDEFDEWRIQVVVYREFAQGESMIGSVLIWSDKLILDKRLYEWMREAQFSIVSCVEPRFYSHERETHSLPSDNLMNDPE